MTAIKEGCITEKLVDASGAVWVRVWRVYAPGMLQLVWERENLTAG